MPRLGWAGIINYQLLIIPVRTAFSRAGIIQLLMASITQRTGLLGFDNAAHLLRRSTFGADKTVINSYAGKTAAEAMEALFQFNASVFPAPRYNGSLYIPTVADPSPVFDPLVHTSIAWLRNWWLHCAFLDNTIQHKIAFFLHSIFITDDSNAIFTVYDHHELLKWHANGSLKDLAVRVTMNLKMLYYLDNRLNKTGAPNENYAREFLELFTIQKGPQIATGNYTNYTELDVQQAARVFTGFDGNQGTAASRLSIFDPVTGIPQGTVTVSKHDLANKTFSTAFGSQVITGKNTVSGMVDELKEFVNMVFAQQATGKSYARRIYRYFVNRTITPEIETDIIAPLANTLINNQYNLKIAITQLLSSVHFYDEDSSTKGDIILGAKIKDPIVYAHGIFKQFKVVIPDYITQNVAHQSFYNNRVTPKILKMGLPIWMPFSVVGYSQFTEAPNYDKLWITPIALASRYADFIDALVKGYTHSGVAVKLDTVLFVRYSGYFSDPSDANKLISELYEILLPSPPQGGRHTYFKEALLGGLSTINWKNDWNSYLSTGVKTAVTTALNSLITTLVKSPEYQVH